MRSGGSYRRYLGMNKEKKEVVKVNEVENTYAIIWENCSVIIKDGRIENSNVMSSGNKA